MITLLSSFSIALVPAFHNQLCLFIYTLIPDSRFGSLAAALSLLFIPLLLMGIFSPFAVRLTSSDKTGAGSVAGRIYGISTLGNIVGTIATTFYLIPTMGTRAITYALSLLNFMCALSFILNNA
jgi:hypothetical protein